MTEISEIPAYNPDLYQYLSPLGWEHVNLTGDYVWRHTIFSEFSRLPGYTHII
ncbi:hypothetical protein [Pseudomonas savastanoi]|uniref:hypothetical protein n=1 Tax=Pseudomonas savastanoi TaxID=29438 RepID=UPI000F419310|nr:hypothetical protein [Pseudomonas savastanoi]RMU17921.1 Transposase [Pseudomonas savastanoi pv. glycinea]